MTIRDQNQEQIQKEFFLIELSQESTGEEPVWNETEPTLDRPDPHGLEDLFLDHRCPLSTADEHRR